MKKTITLPKYMDNMLRQVAERQETSMSGIIQHALTMYFMIEKNAPEQMKKLGSMIPDGQTQIYDYLKTK